MNRSLVFFLAVLLLFCGGMTLWIALKQAAPVVTGSDVAEVKLDPRKKLTEFELTERSGERFSSSEFTGHPWIANFFFARCPQNCWQQSNKVLQLYREFARQGVRFASISVDPENDTPVELEKYAQRLGVADTNWVFLTGKFESIQKVGQDLFMQTVERAGHSEQLMLVDGNGKLRRFYNWKDETQVESLKRDLASLLAGKALDGEVPVKVASPTDEPSPRDSEPKPTEAKPQP